MAGIALPYRVRQRPLPFPRAPRLVSAQSERALPWAVATLLFVTAVLNFYIFQVSVVATSSYELQAIERERDRWRARNEQLELELAKGRSLRWVEFDAISRLGMVRSEDSLYIRMHASEPAPAIQLPATNDEDVVEGEEERVPTEPEAEPEFSQRNSILAWFASLLAR